jgi:hypothetical protein
MALQKLVAYLDEILANFYEEILSQRQLASLFEGGDAQIRALLTKQKQNFIESLEDDADQLGERYRKLGALHYDLRIPSADFLQSTEIWRSGFARHALHTFHDVELLKELEDYFDVVDSCMCQGYLLRQLAADRGDLEVLVARYEQSGDFHSDSAYLHLQWLLKLLEAIERGDATLAPELDVEACGAHKFEEAAILATPGLSAEHLEDLHRRLHNDASSLFLFVARGNYPHVLSLYTSLLNVYKITLIALGNHSLIDRLKRELAAKREELRTLQGIIPICSYCHQIRDEKGSWTALEEYISTHSEAVFSHGVCRPCLSKVKEELETPS